MLKILFQIASVVVLTGVLIGGCTSNNSVTNPVQPLVNGSILGLVTDAVTSLPIVGATVRTEPATQSLTTDSLGFYRVTEVVPGTYTVIVSYTEYIDASASVHVGNQQTVITDIALSPEPPNRDPGVPFDPVPVNGAMKQSTSPSLAWACSDPDGDPLRFDVFLGRDNPPSTVMARDILSTSISTKGLDTGRIYYWYVVAKDSRGGRTEGTVWNFITALPGQTAVPAGNALQLHGGNDAVSILDNPNLNLNPSSLTVEAWVRTITIGDGWHWVVSRGNNDGDLDFQVGLDNRGQFMFQTRNTSNMVYASTKAESGTWYHIAAVQDVELDSVYFYINGDLAGNDVLKGTPDTCSAPLLIGARSHSGSAAEAFNGEIDEVRIWNIARTQDDIRAEMFDRLLGSMSDLIGYWRFDEGIGNVTADVTGHGYGGVLVGSASWVTSTAPIH